MWRAVFLTKAIYNMVVTVVLAIFEARLASSLGEDLASPVYTHAFLALAFIFGLGYWWVSRDITRNHAIVGLGVLGQLSVFVITTTYVVLGTLHPVRLIGGIVDLVFAILYAVFLWKARKGPMWAA